METERKLTLVEEPPVAVIEGLSKTFGSIRALRNISLELPQGLIIGLLGPNGSGSWPVFMFSMRAKCGF